MTSQPLRSKQGRWRPPVDRYSDYRLSGVDNAEPMYPRPRFRDNEYYDSAAVGRNGYPEPDYGDLNGQQSQFESVDDIQQLNEPLAGVDIDTTLPPVSTAG